MARQPKVCKLKPYGEVETERERRALIDGGAKGTEKPLVRTALCHTQITTTSKEVLSTNLIIEILPGFKTSTVSLRRVLYQRIAIFK